MDYQEMLRHISYKLSSVGHTRLGVEWHYEDIVSAFSRLYLITEGEAFVYIGKTKVILEPGYLYLIPSFKNCSYICPEFMEQYYATFSISLANGMNLYQLFNMKYRVKATDVHSQLFKRLCEDNVGMALPVGDPRKYQKNMEMETVRGQGFKSIVSSSGLLSLLIAEFFDTPKMNFALEGQTKITESIKYIHAHIGDSLTLEALAADACLSADHYTRKFKEVAGQTPIDYINQQRIEKAQLLINTSTKTLADIAYLCGFKDSSYFSKVFKRYVHQSPRDYKNKNVGL